MKFGTLLNSLAKKAGVDTTQKAFVDLLATDIEIPDEIANIIDQGLMDINAAKANQDVRKHIRLEAFNGIDAKVSDLLSELGITEAEDITGEKNSYEKIGRLVRKVREIEEKKNKTNKGSEKEAYEKQINDLNTELRTLKASLVEKEKEFGSTREKDLTNFELYKKLFGKNYIFPDEMDSDLKIEYAQGAVNKALMAKGFKIVRDAETGILSLQNKENLPAYNDKNEKYELNSFIDEVLAHNKLLKINDSSAGGGQGNTASNFTPLGGEQKLSEHQRQVVSELDKEIAALV